MAIFEHPRHLMRVYFRTLQLLIAMGLVLSPITSAAQTILSQATNMPQSGDSIAKELVEYVHVISDKEDAVWDFSDLEAQGTYYVKYDTIGGYLTAYDQRESLKYHLRNDSLFLTGYESPMVRMDYHRPLLSMPFNIQLGQSIISSYQGEGTYCGTHSERTFGSLRITADSEGTLILSEKDTLRNTLCLYSVATESIRLNRDSCRNDSDNLKQVITERCQWYTRGYRYPVFETVTSSTYDNLNHVATKQYAYRCPPHLQIELNDSVNERIRLADRQSSVNRNNAGENGTAGHDNQDGDNGFSYQVDVKSNNVTITYSLEQAAEIHVLVVDVMGTVYRDEQQYNSAGSGYSMSIDCSGLRHGQYILYINVNGFIYHTKIPIK